MSSGGCGDLGDRLASWLEGLQLQDQLAEAGLPTYDRDAGGHARWTDPATGEAMTEAQLEAFDRQLHSEGDDPTYAVPLVLVQLARRARVRTDLRASPTHDYASLAALRGETLNATRFAVHKAASGNELLLVARDERVLLPGFQFTDAGAVRDELLPVLRPLLAAGMDPWDVWGWLTQPAGLLGGAVPAEAVGDPEEAPLVVHAAVRLAERAASD